MTTSSDLPPSEEGSRDGEVLPPAQKRKGAQNDESRHIVYADVSAQINKYTDRPDLFLETMERHDPGFIKRMNAEAENFSKINREARYKFGQFQAYATLAIGAIAALFVLYCLYVLIDTKQAGIWPIIGIAILYAVTQGGTKGFLSLISGIKNILSTWSKSDKDSN